MTCQRWVDRGHIKCESSANQISGSCISYKDEGSIQCQYSADQGHNACCDWWPCSWLCDAWYWVANWVCQAWYWLANLVCQAFAWVVNAVCLIWSWIAQLFCVAWDSGACVLRGVFGRRGGNRQGIEHVFVLVLENRSFDHMLGFSEITGVDGVIGTDVFNVDPSAPAIKVPPSIEADFKLNHPADDDPGHEFLDTLVALCGLDAMYNGGAYPPIDNSGFIAEYKTMKARDSKKLVVQDPTKIMKCYSPRRLPVLNALASEFVVCDRWFSSIPGPTWPNRFFLHAASSGGLDDSPTDPQSVGATLFDGYRFENGTIFDRLDDACIEWRIYAGDSFPVSLAISGMTLNELRGRIRGFDEFSEAVNDPGFSTGYIFIEPNYGNDLWPSAGDFTCGNSQHPLDDVTRGERLIKQVYETIRNSPHWDSSVLLVTYDEHGGFFDHVAPPAAAAPGDALSDPDNNHHDFTFEQLGVRVPAVIASPRIPRGLVDHTIYDHTSLLATVEELFGLRPLTNRDAAATPFTHLFTLASPRTDAPTTLPEPAISGFHCDDDPDQPAIRQSVSDLTAGTEGGNGQPVKIAIPGELCGFLHIALLKSLAVARGRDKPGIIRQYLAIRTEATAQQFIYLAARKARAALRPQSDERKR